MEETGVFLMAEEALGLRMCVRAHWDGCVVVGEAGERAGRDHLLVQQRGAALGLGLGAALRQAVVVDLVLFVGNLLTEPGGAAEQEKHCVVFLKHLVRRRQNYFWIFCWDLDELEMQPGGILIGLLGPEQLQSLAVIQEMLRDQTHPMVLKSSSGGT